jgi:hypothetical protein
MQIKYPGLNNIEYTRLLAEMWKGLPEEERQMFKRQAAEMQTEFKMQNPNYAYRKSGHIGGRVSKNRKKRGELREPKGFRWDQMLNHHQSAN